MPWNRHAGIVANPNCSTMQMVMALKPIHDDVGIERVIVSTYQSTSGTGHNAVEELRTQAEAVLGERDVQASVYPHQIAFNVLPQVETFKDGDDYTTEERKMMAETRKILGDDDDRDLRDVRARPRLQRALRVGQRPDARRPFAGALPRDPERVPRRRGGGRAGGGPLSDADRRRGPRRGVRRAHPARSLARALPELVDRRRQPAQGRGDERGPARRAAGRARTWSAPGPAFAG